MSFDMPSSRGEPEHEPALIFNDKIVLSPQKEVVRVFYKEMWDHADKSLIPAIFHEDFTFRGSLGPMLRGHEEFGRYVDWVTSALGDYTSDILALVEEDERVTGKLRFHGYHQQEMFGVPPSGYHVWWYGAPIFTFENGKVRDLWVLGDIYGLIQRLQSEGEPIRASSGTNQPNRG
ncbi:MAG TPA: ester cyclase [Microvirga sp.]|jgi:predicted ester cyclase|nr:ester cyclase [Microvirga sp.]